MKLAPKGTTSTLSKRGEKDHVANLPHKMGAFVPDGVPLNREWRRRLKREKK